QLPLEPGHHVSRGRVADSGGALTGELCVAEPVRAVAAETASRPPECGDETPQLRLERCLLDGSRYRINTLVCAGPGARPTSRSAASLPPECRPRPSPPHRRHCRR